VCVCVRVRVCILTWKVRWPSPSSCAYRPQFCRASMHAICWTSRSQPISKLEFIFARMWHWKEAWIRVIDRDTGWQAQGSSFIVTHFPVTRTSPWSGLIPDPFMTSLATASYCSTPQLPSLASFLCCTPSLTTQATPQRPNSQCKARLLVQSKDQAAFPASTNRTRTLLKRTFMQDARVCLAIQLQRVAREAGNEQATFRAEDGVGRSLQLQHPWVYEWVSMATYTTSLEDSPPLRALPTSRSTQLLSRSSSSAWSPSTPSPSQAGCGLTMDVPGQTPHSRFWPFHSIFVAMTFMYQ
jgi:hypothetical protein